MYADSIFTPPDYPDDWRDPDVPDDTDHAYIASQLRPDSEFQSEKAQKRFPFDDDQADAFICHCQGGYDVRVSSEDLRKAFADGTTGDPTFDIVVADVLGELARWALEETFMQSGASPREIARFYREKPNFITWKVVLTLNPWSDKGQRDLPWFIDKLAGVWDPMTEGVEW